MQQLTFDFEIWYENPKDLRLFPEGSYLHLYHISIENRVIDGLYKIIKHYKKSVDVLYHYKYNKDNWTFASTNIKHSDIVRFKEWN
ncbi:hypothetical protein [Lysinibacillus halotolerans]|uniref:Uncharacterized protein n=1 Tax=Lysinibacillus halotolerans TaxID=1368476 RepID=A0A3M8HDX7_9BACI|nr:hypothetical protein [Lysinibacillus halotolerans]RND00251.1 hypothetical protein EC501_05615 [Lysinibacillus halotolerans]